MKYLVVILIFFTSCSVYRKEMNTCKGKDVSFLSQKYGKVDSSWDGAYDGKKCIALLYKSNDYGVFHNPTEQKRLFVLQSGVVKDWYFIQWGKDYQDRIVIKNRKH